MQALAEDSDGLKYLLTVIYVFSKRAYARVLKSKNWREVSLAFSSVLEEAAVPEKNRAYH